MLLVKCACGCTYTIFEEKVKTAQWIHCPQCDERTYVGNNCTPADLIHQLSKNSSAIQKVPDSAKITISFDA